MNITANKQVTEHFKYTDCICPCCDHLIITPLFFSHMEKLEGMRMEVGFPIIINSGHRCPVHNTIVGGVLGSWHMKFATDTRPAWVPGMDDEEYLKRLKNMYNTADELGFGGLGKYSTFIHCDMRPVRTRWTG